ncbi:CRISPR-associated exonuclease Cas4/endonuclease Cas1 fusion [Alicyclobacillus cellulosilyticus]|uniref:CRISPR-associated endonuclease Cas1 n=1 Tax=Alicyclobacillus cellulosilyticus TaxID=1003997 RepID=A0A917KB39_9BACL|nr:type I-MYXAN CRISPR-associated endonuclease Cas1 [Alicyclobacillus cellulosilyticus]GGJ07640.1 CRISPR-associated exonuclease Cas4/endonuclease Cas1 fusion [Alicyclobacillus cellulosilyticus]
MDDAEPLTRVMALHALVYCERLFYLEEVEEIRIADQSVYDGRRLHEQLPEYVELTSYTLESERLGIKGKVDVVRTIDGRWVPFEYKKGRARLSRDGRVQAWPSDEIQICAYALLLEEHFERPITEGRVYYAADHRTAVVLVDEELRARFAETVRRAAELRRSTQRPPVTSNTNLCTNCSLAPVCLPEEERLLLEVSAEPAQRFFPADREGSDLHVTSPGATVRRSGGTVIVEERGGERKEFPIHEIVSISLHGHVQVTTQTIHACASEGIPIHFFTTGGRYVGSIGNLAGGVQRRLRQYAGLTDPAMVLYLAKRLVTAKVESQLRYVLRLTREKQRETVESEIEVMREAVKHVHRASSLDELRGWEGLAGRAYFTCLGTLTRDDGQLALDGRNRRPPRDPANALLSFWYALLYRDCVRAILVVGLDPSIGFYHQPRSSAYPLALDLMEMFRVTLCDMILVGSLHRRQWSVGDDFVQAGKQCWLSPEGRKKAIELYERRKQDKWKHPVIGYSLSYDRAIELEVRLLEKEWSGAPGLFARNRIR